MKKTNKFSPVIELTFQLGYRKRKTNEYVIYQMDTKTMKKNKAM